MLSVQRGSESPRFQPKVARELAHGLLPMACGRCALLVAAFACLRPQPSSFLAPRRPSRTSLRALVSDTGIRWLQLDASRDTASDGQVMPVFVLQGAYFPFAESELSIFEARYRELYNDILVSGSRRFVVVAPHPEHEDRLAQVGAQNHEIGSFSWLSRGPAGDLSASF